MDISSFQVTPLDVIEWATRTEDLFVPPFPSRHKYSQVNVSWRPAPISSFQVLRFIHLCSSHVTAKMSQPAADMLREDFTLPLSGGGMGWCGPPCINLSALFL